MSIYNKKMKIKLAKCQKIQADNCALFVQMKKITNNNLDTKSNNVVFS